MILAPGMRFSHYEISALLGVGGMGEVYLAKDTRLGRQVALKLVSLSSTNGGQVAAAVEIEARLASALNHPNVLTVYEIGRTDTSIFIASEFVEGETLRARLAREALPLDQALDVSLQIGSALAVTHAKGLIHCDLKPENIMLRPDGVVKVLDFGLARLAVQHRMDQPTNGRQTESAEFISGTIGYLAPELLRGIEADARADLWSLGVVLFEMIAGRRPFERGTAEDELRAILHEEAPVLSSLRPDVPISLGAVIGRALAKNRDERFQSADEVITNLKRAAERLGLPIARPLMPTQAPTKENKTGDKRLPAAPESSLRGNLAGQFRLLRTHKRWLLHVGALAFLMAFVSATWRQMGGGSWLPASILFVLAILCFAAWALLRRLPLRALAVQPPGVAFRGLLPFHGADREHFYGRDIDTQALYTMVAHQTFRFGVLFGDSGSGKTSLLLAGLAPKLWEEGYVPLYCRSFSDPLTAVVEECRKRSRLALQAGESPVLYLQRASRELDATLIVICDQFEEFFANFKTADERAPFIEFVAACHARSDLPVKFLFSLRSDFLYLINAAFAGSVPEPLLGSKLYHLHNFDEQVAADIVERSARGASLPFEPGLSRHIAHDLAVNRTVAPSELQIVGAQLQARRIFTFEAYRRAGSKEALVHDFLEDVIQASGDADSARLLLRSLISEENTRVTLSIAEICKRTQRSRDLVWRLLLIFANARVVREIQEAEPWRYELMHEYLIDKINRVTGQVQDATQRANRHFRQYLTNYSLDQRTRIPLTRLWSIRRYSDLPHGKAENQLLRRSARAGIAKVAASVCLLAIISVGAAAYLSVNESWQSVRLSDGHTASARHVVFSPDGRRLISCGEDSKVIVWDFATRQRIATLTDHQGWVNWVDYSPDGKWFATASQDQTVIVWDAVTLQKAAVLREHRSGVSTLVFSPDGKWLASASGDNDERMVLWEVNGWRKVREIAYGLKWGQLLFSPDSRRLLCPNGWSWDVATGQRLTEDMDPLGTYGALDAKGAQLLSIDGGGNVSLLDLAQRKIIFRTRGHQFHGRVAIFSPDGRLWATGSEDIVLWDAATRTKLLRLPYVSEVWGLAFSRDGRWLVSSYTDGAILLWDTKEREVAASFNEHSGSVRAVAFSADGRRLASASEDKSVIVWNVAQGRKDSTLAGHNTRVTSVAFAPRGDWLVSGDQDGHVIRWDTQQQQPRWDSQQEPAVPAYCVTVSPDGRWVAETNGINDANDGHLVVDFLARAPAEHIGGQLYGLAFSPDGQKLIGVTNLGQVLMWDTGTWQLVQRVELKGASLICVAFAADGEHFVTGEDEGAVRFWETNGLRQISVIGRHTARVKAVDFSPDGGQVVSAGDDQSISLWSVAGRRLITHLGTHTAPVLAVAFAPDGKKIAAGGQDKSAHIYTRHRTLWGYNLD